MKMGIRFKVQAGLYIVAWLTGLVGGLAGNNILGAIGFSAFISAFVTYNIWRGAWLKDT